MDVTSHPYQAVADEMAAEIERGGIKQRLPSVRQLAKDRGVSPVTAQRALARLAEMGYAISGPAGYSVAPSENWKRPAGDIGEQLAELRAQVASLESRVEELESREAK